jgi:hypothetical protein
MPGGCAPQGRVGRASGRFRQNASLQAFSRKELKLRDNHGQYGQASMTEDLILRGCASANCGTLLGKSADHQALLNARNMAETIIGHIKEFSSLNLSKHDPSSTPSFRSSRPSPPTRSTRSSPSATFSPATISKPQPENP